VRRLSVVLSETPSGEVRLSLPRPEGRVEVDNLHCFAPGQEKPILAGVSFKAAPGTGLGIIGATGAGKTTLAKALVGVWPQYRGTVRLDGASLDQWDAGQLGEHIGYMPQEVELFEGSVADNIARFQHQKNSDDIVRAARAADVHNLILKIPDGYNAMLGESGIKLSAGQRQRVGLARALYRDPAFVVLDEPNANLDAEGEAALIKAIIEIRRRGGTVVVVAHRPSAVAALDMLMVLRDGRAVAFGRRDDILQGFSTKPRVLESAGLSVVSKEA
jgi:ABC-type protease/lipase transport system fused ATPase/permease subunit